VGAVEREAPQGKPDQRRRKRPGTSGGVSDSERVAGAGGYYLERVAEAGEDDGLGPAGEDDGLGHVDLTA
jgi:hypothetical protein